MKKYYKVYNYSNGYLVINFVGEEKKSNVDEQEIEALLDKAFGTLNQNNDIAIIVPWIRFILEDYDEQEMFVSTRINDIQKKLCMKIKP